MIINKEKAVCFAAAGLLFFGVVYAAGSWPSISATEVKIPRPDAMPEEPRFVYQEARVFAPSFMEDYLKDFAGRANPFQADSGRRSATPADYPLPAPWDLPVSKMVPVSGTLGNRAYSATLSQKSAPKEINAAPKNEDGEEEQPEDGGDEGDSGDESGSIDRAPAGRKTAEAPTPPVAQPPARPGAAERHASDGEDGTITPLSPGLGAAERHAPAERPAAPPSRESRPGNAAEKPAAAPAKASEADLTDDEIDEIIDEVDGGDYLDDDDDEGE
jgi:hypothetical protein